MKSNNPFIQEKEKTTGDADAEKNIDQTDAEENHSTASEGDEFLKEVAPDEQAAETSDGDLTDRDMIANNEDGEYDRDKISDK